MLLRTRLLERFASSHAQVAALFHPESLRPSLAAMVRTEGRPDHLELTTTLDLHDTNRDWVERMLVAAARAQAAEVRLRMAPITLLKSAGLTPLIDPEADLPAGLVSSGETGPADVRRTQVTAFNCALELLVCLDELRMAGETDVVRVPGVLSATLPSEDGSVRSILEIRADSGRPLAGRGISVSLWTPVHGGPLEALTWNERDTGRCTLIDALGGWWASSDGTLVHSSFYPAALCDEGQVGLWLRGYLLRARQANRVASGDG